MKDKTIDSHLAAQVPSVDCKGMDCPDAGHMGLNVQSLENPALGAMVTSKPSFEIDT